jgi:transcriptional regulator with XRE-family HTH domain
MLKTGNQLKAARALVGLSQGEVAERAGVHLNTISAMEKRGPNLLTSGFDIVTRVARVLEVAGVMFIAGNGHGPGVVLKKSSAEPAGAPQREAGKTGSRKKPGHKRSGPLRPNAVASDSKKNSPAQGLPWAGPISSGQGNWRYRAVRAFP